ncbi:extracellular solute-binding protein [Oceanobacillus sp. 143]|uniref:Sugar ABC transporter substrate-binding protein n=1 Tax=Oceanobacillus zhaokaii TaxID=2052660 RepID=A0A345PKM8_9BACI|nr:sugar ABC transporter substrate-binding protein [Oceanobacillus zhaokaii]AXI10558.1 sugar ABC transporter substrate-binding protein [Oceanobacillus zhaokaii]QGS69533.1 extracellular solute-binding protein [Oceanobacillus sp. 143]
MRKRIGFLVMLLTLGLVLAACNSDGEETAGTGGDGEVSGEITVWVHPYTGDAEAEKEMWDGIIARYNEEFPEAKVNIETIPWSNRDQKILTALAANNGPDVFYAIPDQMPQYADEGMLLELDPYLEGYDMDDFVDSALVSTTWKDKMYGLPILQEAYTFFYNVDVIEAIGEDPENLPTTWEEFETWAEKAKEKDFYALSYAGGGSMNGTLYPWIWQAGGDVITQDDEVLINSPESVEAFEFINNMYEKGYLPEDSITAMEHDALFQGGQMLAVLGSGISLTNLQAIEDFNFVIAPPLQNKEQVTYGTTGMFVVPSNSDNPDAAAEFVKVVTNADSQRDFNTVTQYIPTRESAKDIFDSQEYLSQLATYTEFALPGVIHPIGRNIMPLIQAEVQTMMEGKKTPKEAADAAAAVIEAELAK